MTYLMAALTIALLALQALDILSTLKDTDTGLGQEANPILKVVFGWLPESKWWVVKLVILPVLAGMWYAFLHEKQIVVLVVMGIAVAAYGYVVWNNYKIANGA
jgi:hypothetical protein